MASRSFESVSRSIAHRARPLTGSPEDFDPVLDLIGDARIVLLGEATHGTHEFYRRRMELTRRLIEEKGFRAVAVETGWPDAYRVNRYVRGLGKDRTPVEALGDFKRFPAWTWRNVPMLDFVHWLRAHNDRVRRPAEKAGFYGLDLYSLRGSLDGVIEYLDGVDVGAAHRARQRYACFEQFGVDPRMYGHATSLELSPEREREVVSRLLEMQRHRQESLAKDGYAPEDELFQEEQNAQVVRNAEWYYRSMFTGHVSCWNFRDSHMADTLDALLEFLGRSGRAGVVVWAHNAHVGDARATEMGKAGEINIGQILRARHASETRLIGFTTYTGTVTAASEWGGPVERMHVHPAVPGSYEDLFHHAGYRGFLLTASDLEGLKPLHEPHLQRAIGVVYLPETERQNHYFYAELSAQFDAVLHLDTTRALEPVERPASWEPEEERETYLTGV